MPGGATHSGYYCNRSLHVYPMDTADLRYRFSFSTATHKRQGNPDLITQLSDVETLQNAIPQTKRHQYQLKCQHVEVCYFKRCKCPFVRQPSQLFCLAHFIRFSLKCDYEMQRGDTELQRFRTPVGNFPLNSLKWFWRYFHWKTYNMYSRMFWGIMTLSAALWHEFGALTYPAERKRSYVFMTEQEHGQNVRAYPNRQ